MKSFIFAGFIFLTQLAASGQTVAAKPLHLDFSAVKKRLEVEKKDTADKTIAQEKWVYEVTIKNTSFADQADLTVEYRCFKRDDKYGATKAQTKLPLKPIPGTEKIAAFPNSTSHKFTTTEVQIDKDELKAGWTYTSGAKEKIKDSLYGIWLRVFKNGEMVAEFVSPPTLREKAQWE